MSADAMPERWAATAALFVERGIPLESGLTSDELGAIEERFDVVLPPDLRSMLATFLPSGARFPDWRDLGSTKLASLFSWPLEGLLFDAEHGTWSEPLGADPGDHELRIERVRQAVSAAPRLIPLVGHRYLPSEPCEAGNPVFSVHQGDIIVYGDDLETFWRVELGAIAHVDRVRAGHRLIRFWSDFV